MDSRIELLGPDSPLLDTVVAWHWREWSHGYDDPDRDTWRANVNGRTRRDGVPFTLIAHLDSEPVAEPVAEPVGCVSVCDDDGDARFPDRGPWLSGMLVLGHARNLGVGRALVGRAEDLARNLGVRELWVATTEAGRFYARCGWVDVVPKEGLHGRAVMCRTL